MILIQSSKIPNVAWDMKMVSCTLTLTYYNLNPILAHQTRQNSIDRRKREGNIGAQTQ